MNETRPAAESATLMSPERELARIDHTATLWFAAAITAMALVLSGVLISGWRPAELDPVASVFWWVGATLAIVGLSAIGYAGCPIYWAMCARPICRSQSRYVSGLHCFSSARLSLPPHSSEVDREEAGRPIKSGTARRRVQARRGNVRF